MTTYPWFGNVRSAWPTVQIRRVAALGTGHTPDRDNEDYWIDCSIPWVTVADIQALPGSGLDPLMDTEQQISELGLANSAAVLHPAGTVFVSRTASIGHACRSGVPMATTQAFVTWTPGPDVDSLYLLLAAKVMAPELDRLAYGATHTSIYMPDLEALRMPLPPLAEQQDIAARVSDQVAQVDQILEGTGGLGRLASLLVEYRRAVMVDGVTGVQAT